MYEHFKEASLPITYRRREIECLVRPLALQRSVRLVGLSGMGKSNLLRFLVSHPRLLQDDPDLPVAEVCFLYVDCNKLHPVNALNFYRECIFRLQAQADLSTQADAYLLYKGLESALGTLEAQVFVILVVDRCESLYQQMGREFFGQLRNLRDEARRGRMAFIFGSQRPIGELYDLEKLFSDTCWIGPLAVADRPEFFARHSRRLKIKVGKEEEEILWRLTGAHPGLLKNSLEWLKRRGRSHLLETEADLVQDLLSYAPIQKYCRQLWAELTPAEQTFLLELEHNPPEALMYPLKEAGLIIDSPTGPGLFSPLWQAYLRQQVWPQQPRNPLQIELELATRRVVLHWAGKTAGMVITRHLVFELLQVLAAAPDKVHTKDELIGALYRAEKADDVYDDALFQLVTALRKSLDTPVKRLCPAMTGSCIQNVRGVGYRLIVDLPLGLPSSQPPQASA